MSKIKYTQEQINKLNSNPNVIMIKYGRQIEYKPFFKRWAVIQSLTYPDMSANQIFEKAGFDISIIGSRVADSRIRSWKEKFYKSNPDVKKSKTDYSEKNYNLLVMLCNKFDSLIGVLLRRDK